MRRHRIRSGRPGQVRNRCLYVQKGVKYEGRLEEGADWIQFDFGVLIDQIAVPVLVKIKFMQGTSPYVLLGGEVAYLLAAKAKFSIEDSDGYSESDTEDILEDTNKLDYSVVGGAGVEMAMGAFRLFLEARYVYGLANLIKETDYSDPDDWVKLTTILIVGGIGF